MAAPTTKRCHYEVLGLTRDCTPDEIRSAYKKLALQRHPDKLMQSGLTQAEATAQFQELAQAYEVLSDAKERAWYDSHRSQILFSDSDSVSDSAIPNLFSFFSPAVFSGYSDAGKGFYKVYSDVFNKIYASEINFCKRLGLGLERVRDAPAMGNLESPYAQVTAFYNYWLGFCTEMDFAWVDQYDVMAGPNRKSRRVMEEENKKLRRKARREYNETVRGLAEFVKKRDKRVIDMAVKRNAEAERRKEEERERKKRVERERIERMRNYVEPEWAQVDEEDELEEVEDEKKGDGNEGKELYCVVCRKKFKSEKQWKNHEQSRKHKEKVAELRESFVDEDEEREEDFEENVDEIEESFKEGFRIGEEGNEGGIEEELSDEENGFFDAVEDEDEDEDGGDGETSVLEAMVSGHKSRKHRSSRHVSEEVLVEVQVEDENKEDEIMEYNNRKSRRRKGKKDRSKNIDGEAVKGDINESRSWNEEINGLETEESTSHTLAENGNDGDTDNHSGKTSKTSNQSVDQKGAAKKETNTKSKNLSRGKKGKATSKNSGNVCGTCGVEFESRNKLHKHLGDSGHASLKFR